MLKGQPVVFDNYNGQHVEFVARFYRRQDAPHPSRFGGAALVWRHLALMRLDKPRLFYWEQCRQ
ncbi:Uncharacterised protein [Yersinia enterocolitica]|nr:Uncharacterised protein [Yersinia enterocolitica]